MIGRLIDGRYQVRSRIARGGMATVYLATDLRLERRVAVKIMHGHLADDVNFKNRFVQEARSAARLSHPNVVNVFDQGQDSDMAYLVMEYLPGITLRDLIRDYGELTPEQTVDILDSVLRGLAAAHRAGIVHRDLKPENVLLADDGRIKLGDFGLARAASSNTATGAALLGTIAYLSPELVTRGIADTRSDIYALGIMMYEMLTGEQPYRGEQPMQIAYQHANDEVPAPSAKSPNVPPEFDELVRWSTARNPDDRPRDAGELLERLSQIESLLRLDAPATTAHPTIVLPAAEPSPTGETQVLQPAGRRTAGRAAPASTAPVATLERAARKRGRRGWWLFSLVLLLAAAVGGTGWYFGTGPGSLVTIPSLAGAQPDAATAQLSELGFEVSRDEVYSVDIAKGLVAGTTPDARRAVARGAHVTVHVSQGPRPIELPALAGLTREAAEKAITGAGATVAKNVDVQFNAEVAPGIVISAAKAADDKADLSGGGAYFQGMPVALVVSAGALPDVAGLTVEAAKTALQKAGLTAETGSEVFSDTVDSGKVVGIVSAQEGPVRPGDSVFITISKGPELFPLPDVTDKTKDEATKLLSDAGFTVDYEYDLPDFVKKENLPDRNTRVTRMDPKAGTSVPKGTQVTLTIEFRFFS